jgi:hypothetical protein
MAGRRVRLVDDERLARLEAQLEEAALAVLRAQQVAADAHVRLREAVAEERGLPAGLDAAQDDGLHLSARAPGQVLGLGGPAGAQREPAARAAYQRSASTVLPRP